jgi:hypothetical protein
MTVGDHMMNTVMSKVIRAIVLISATGLVSDNLLAKENFPIGCWSRTSFDGRTVSGLWLCFYENGNLHGVDVARGHGADFNAQWELVEKDKLRLTAEGNEDTCSVYWTSVPEKLTLEACSEPFLNGVFSPDRN